MKQNKFLVFLVLIILLFTLAGNFILAAERELEVEYPKIDKEEITATTTLPEYIKYIFKLSLIIAAVAAFAILIYGGFRYLTSAGDPGVLKEAKSWMFGGILGLVLLLCSYLILTTINPELLSPKEPEVKPFVGIYLINAEGKKLYYIQDMPEIPKDFNPRKIVFISDRPANPDFADPNKAELDSVFVYPEKNWGGNPTRIENDGAWTTSSDSIISSLKSFKFLWHRPGIYLYDQETGWEKTDSWPTFLRSSASNHRDLGGLYDTKAKSLKIVNSSINEPYWALLFEHIDFKGKSDFVWQDTSSFSDRIRDQISSITIFKVTPQYTRGKVIFYDQEKCVGNKYSWEPLAGTALPYSFVFSGAYFDTDQTKPVENNVVSFRNEGNFSILINIKADLSGESQFFTKIGCTPSLLGADVYWWPCCEGRPKIAVMFPVIE